MSMIRVVLMLAAAAVLLGCGDPESSEDGDQSIDEAPKPSVVEITMSDGQVLADGAMIVEVFEGDFYSPPASFVLSGVADDGTKWQVSAGMTIEDLDAQGELRWDVAAEPPSDAIALVTVLPTDGDPSPSDHATDGALSMTIGHSAPQVSGTVVVSPESMSASFAGTFQVWCYSVNTDNEFVVDESFSSEFCSRFAHWQHTTP